MWNVCLLSRELFFLVKVCLFKPEQPIRELTYPPTDTGSM